MSDRMATGHGTTDPAAPGASVKPNPADVAGEKRRLRTEMRQLRRGLVDRATRSDSLWRHVVALPEVADAQRIMGFSHVPGEPEIDGFRSRWRADGREWAEPEAGVDPHWPDVVIVPGLAFTRAGHRLGQGGGWYDRFLPAVRSDCVTIGVGFAEQVLDRIPTERHDVVLDHVVVDTGRITTR